MNISGAGNMTREEIEQLREENLQRQSELQPRRTNARKQRQLSGEEPCYGAMVQRQAPQEVIYKTNPNALQQQPPEEMSEEEFLNDPLNAQALRRGRTIVKLLCKDLNNHDAEIAELRKEVASLRAELAETKVLEWPRKRTDAA